MRPPSTVTLLSVLALAAVVAVTVAGCDKFEQPKLLATALTTDKTQTLPQAVGNAAFAPKLFRSYGCVACHTIPGIQGAEGLVGPPLTKMAYRGYVAGVLTNTPPNLVRWIQNPPAVDPLTAMPNLNVTASDAHDMAAYLYTLK